MKVPRPRALACMLAAGLLLAGVAASFGTTAEAKSSAHFYKAVRSAGPASSDVAPLAKPAGYKIVQAGPFNSPGNTQSLGKATCPGTKVPVGGGALISPAGSNNPILFANVNSSYPFGNSWFVDVNTSSSSGADADFDVYAVCIDEVASYSVVSSSLVDNPAGTSTLATASCPTNRVLVGGERVLQQLQCRYQCQLRLSLGKRDVEGCDGQRVGWGRSDRGIRRLRKAAERLQRAKQHHDRSEPSGDAARSGLPSWIVSLEWRGLHGGCCQPRSQFVVPVEL